MKLFQKDSPWIRLIDNIGNLTLLNLLYLLFCLPVVTIGPATTALYSCTLCMARHETLELSRFRRVFRREFVLSLKLWLGLLLVGALLAADYFFLKDRPELPAALNYLLYALLFFAACLTLYVFPLIARFTNTPGQYIALSLALALRNLPKTLLMLALTALPAILFLLNAELALRLMIFWIVFGMALTAFFNSFFLSRIFAGREERAEAAAAAESAEAEAPDEDGADEDADAAERDG